MEDSYNDSLDSEALNIQIVGALVPRQAMENLLRSQSGFAVVDQKGAVVLILGRDGQTQVKRDRVQGSRRQKEYYALLTNGTDIDFRLAQEASIQVFIGVNEPIGNFLQALRSAAEGNPFCSSQIITAFVNAAAAGSGSASSALRSVSVPQRALSIEFNDRQHSVRGTPSASPAAMKPFVTVDETDKTAPPQLSPREAEIAHEAARGLSNREIAEKLYITTATVKFHLYHAFQKLGIERRAQLTNALLTLTLEP